MSMKIGLIFFDTYVPDYSSPEEAKPSICQQILCGAGAMRARLANAYQDTRRYIHCEVYFPKTAFTPEELARIRPPEKMRPGESPTPDSDLVVAFASFNNVPTRDIARAKGVTTTRQNHGTIGMLRAFTSPKYKSLTLRVSAEQFVAAKNFAMNQLGKPYDHSAASWRILLFPPAPSTSRYWCASLAHAILKKAGFLTWQPLNTLDVTKIVVLVSKSKRVEGSVAHPRQMRLTAQIMTDSWFGPTHPTGVIPPGTFQQMAKDARAAIDASCNAAVPPV